MNGKIAAAFVLFSSGILLATNAVILILIDLTEKKQPRAGAAKNA